jgi:copper chaperone CopZ/uncharacterized membrane protein YphA (DoxX/SURF4 family)
MKHTYQISGMTCQGCKAKVNFLLSAVTGIKTVEIDLENGEATLEMDKNIAFQELKDALKDYPKYQLSEKAVAQSINPFVAAEEQKSWFQTYKPILIIFGYVSVISIIAGSQKPYFDTMMAMRVFMAGFFITFSFFKMLDLKGFAKSYAMYDIVALRFKAWGYIYAFIELGLGLAFATNFAPYFTNIFTAIIMSVSIIGVLISVFNKRKIQCACLGAVFNLPMSTVTIIEDAIMIVMSLSMLTML